MLGDLNRERNEFLDDWRRSCDKFTYVVYHRIIKTTTSRVTAIVKGGDKSSVIDDGNQLTYERSPSIDAKPGAGNVRFSQKFKSNGEFVEMNQPLTTIATPVPILTKSLTPRRETKHSTVANEGLNWGDRVRSFSPSKNDTSIPDKMPFSNPLALSPSMIPKPPPLPAPSEEQTAMEEPLEEAEKEEDKPVEMPLPVEVESVERVSISGKVEPVSKTQAKQKIPALERAAMVKEQQEKQEQTRKNRKAKLRKKWKKDKTKVRSPMKAAEKPDELHCGVKRPSELDSSVNKRQKTEAMNNRIKKNKVVKKAQGLQTPEMPGPSQSNVSPEDLSSPQYDLTPVGMLHTDYDKKLHRRNKHIPSWADTTTLEKEMIEQKEKANEVFQTGPGTFSPRTVFGKPDPMVTRNVAARTQRYEHRSRSSAEWSDNEQDNTTN